MGQERRQLGVACRAPQVHRPVPGDGGRQRVAAVPADQVQGEVDAGRDAGALGEWPNSAAVSIRVVAARYLDALFQVGKSLAFRNRVDRHDRHDFGEHVDHPDFAGMWCGGHRSAH